MNVLLVSKLFLLETVPLNIPRYQKSHTLSRPTIRHQAKSIETWISDRWRLKLQINQGIDKYYPHKIQSKGKWLDPTSLSWPVA